MSHPEGKGKISAGRYIAGRRRCTAPGIVAKAVAEGWRSCYCVPDSRSEEHMVLTGQRNADAASASLGIASRTRSLNGGVASGMWSARSRAPALPRRFRHCGFRTDLAAKSVPNRIAPRSHDDRQRAGLPTHLTFGGSISRLPSPRRLCDILLRQGVHSPC